MSKTTISNVLEKTTPKITANIVDEDGNAIPALSLTTLTLDLFVSSDPTQVIRAAQDVLNNNNVVVDGAGLLTWSVQIADTTIYTNCSLEVHRAEFIWTWDSGDKRGSYRIDIPVVNMKKVT